MRSEKSWYLRDLKIWEIRISERSGDLREKKLESLRDHRSENSNRQAYMILDDRVNIAIETENA